MTVSSSLRKCVLSLCLAFGACSVFDERLEPRPAGSSSDSGSGGIAGSATGGSGGQSTGGMGGQSGDAAVPVGDAGDVTRCGDGLVTGTELCDLGIASDAPGVCPTECPALSDCVMRALNGTGCRAECVVLQAQCSGGDGCCPGNCMPSNDDDCSASCGDGIVQASEGETCEPEPSGDAGDAERCPADCDDDNACTTDVLSGSAMNCNIDCAHVAITALADGDDCCPEGANTLNDADCMPICGNDVRERGEDCDSASGCNQQCDLGYTAEQRQCLDTFAITNQTCDVCLCLGCTQPKLACFADSDEARGALCVDLQACVRSSGCFDSECFCGTSFACRTPNGPCRAEVEAGAGTTNALDIDARKMDPNYAIGRSYAIDTCVVDQCASACE